MNQSQAVARIKGRKSCHALKKILLGESRPQSYHFLRKVRGNAALYKWGWRNPLRIPDCCYSSSFFSYTPIRPITATHRLAQHQEYCYTRNKSIWDPRPFTPDAFYTELVLQQKHFKPNSFCTRSPQHHTPFCTRTYLYTAQAFYTRNPFTPARLNRQKPICLSFTRETHLKSRPQLHMHCEVLRSSRKFKLPTEVIHQV